MSKIEHVCEQWQDVRNGLIKEVEQISPEQMSFKPAPESRTVIELLHHIIESQRILAGEMCRENTNFQRGFPALIADHVGNVKEATTKEAVLDLLRSSQEETNKMVVDFGDANFEQTMTRFDGKQCTKSEMLNFTISHEMYHRGQITVYERLLGIEPALTQLFRKMTSASS
jgi:uncharacterized damage-inducible protein DinB